MIFCLVTVLLLPLVTAQSCKGRCHGLSDEDLLYLSSLLLSQDTDSAQGEYLISPQCTTRPGSPTDCSSAPLFSFVSPSLLEKPIYVKLRKLYDNYIQNPGIAEDHTE